MKFNIGCNWFLKNLRENEGKEHRGKKSRTQKITEHKKIVKKSIHYFYLSPSKLLYSF